MFKLLDSTIWASFAPMSIDSLIAVETFKNPQYVKNYLKNGDQYGFVLPATEGEYDAFYASLWETGELDILAPPTGPGCSWITDEGAI